MPLLLAAAFVCYLPGLSGPFLFDDHPNLSELGKFGGVRDFETLTSYIFGNAAGPTGRPLSMLSFLLNDNDWPSTPASFKLTNLLFHLLAGLFCFGLLRSLLHHRVAPHERDQADLAALMAMALWLLNPLFVSTTLYIVQRMAMLCACLVLLSLWAYCAARRKGAPKWQIYAAIFAGTPLAVLAKENGALVPLLAACLEYFWIRHYAPPLPRRQQLILFGPSIGMLAGYTAYTLLANDWSELYSMRNFSLGERLLSQPRAFASYLYQWFYPFSVPTGLYADNFAVSTNLLTPRTTLLALIGSVIVLVAAPQLDRKIPGVKLLLSFYLAGHALESTIWPLELYFEHRNYLPTVLFGLPLAALMLVNRHGRWLLISLMCVWIGSNAYSTSKRASIWSNEVRLKAHWHTNSPESVRSAVDLAGTMAALNRPDLAAKVIENTREHHADNGSLALLLAIHSCKAGSPQPIDESSVKAKLATGPIDVNIEGIYEMLYRTASNHYCDQIDIAVAIGWLHAVTSNPNHPKPSYLQTPYYWLGNTQLLAEDVSGAVNSFKKSLKYGPSQATAMQEVSVLARAAYPCEALEILRASENIPILKKNKFAHSAINFSSERIRIRGLIKSDLRNRGLQCATPSTHQ